jgi:crotonobetainyl-CoA:carnitine CoA-transferase CaiB-like acyl-CoA transferase
MQAESGLMAITGEPGGEPMRFGVAIADIACGMVAVQSILAALLERQATGTGQYLDLALYDCALNLLVNIGSGYLNTGAAPRRFGNAHPTVVPYQIFPTADGCFALAVGNDRQFAALCEKVVGLPGLAHDARFATASSRALNRDALIPRLADVFATGTRDHWMRACAAVGVPAGQVKTIPEVLDDPRLRERGVVRSLRHPDLGPVSLVGPAHGLAAQKTASYRPPPLLGQDTQAVLENVLGYDTEAIQRLREAGAIGVCGTAGPQATA